ncbi:hypothetical protein [Humibacillus xanthopallidus]|uniref:hypothetical protein n=1 Tax=Humibacillus xanthopallidus TaxID=412689 RepID=UPI00115195C9|nr:hypothetical protein [Humibacillus xanthopallidus]
MNTQTTLKVEEPPKGGVRSDIMRDHGVTLRASLQTYTVRSAELVETASQEQDGHDGRLGVLELERLGHRGNQSLPKGHLAITKTRLAGLRAEALTQRSLGVVPFVTTEPSQTTSPKAAHTQRVLAKQQ